jgi:septal ring factor EnvC (AmiA/AmiB activator)
MLWSKGVSIAVLMLWSTGVTIAALMAWVAYYEREKRKEFHRMMKQHNIQVREMNQNYRPLENDFSHLETRVDDLAEELREIRQAVDKTFKVYHKPIDERSV